MNFSLKAKGLIINSLYVRLRFIAVLFISVFFIGLFTANAQRPGRPGILSPANRPLDTPADSVKTPSDSTKTKPKGDIGSVITYSATDSINSSIDKKIMKLYGEAHIKYGEIELDADVITINYENSTIHAMGKEDSLGRRVGFPVFTNGAEQYETREILYNFKTKRAIISEVVTKQGEGLIHGKRVYKTPNNEILSVKNVYTTCDLPDPHFKIISTKSKAIPGDKIVSGPFYMEFNHVPIPVGLPFGMFPSKIEATSGILVPSYGEEGRRGLFLKNGGYYLNINEFMNLTVTGDVYSRGSNALNIVSNYNKRYRYTGNFNFAITNNRFNENIEDTNVQRDYRITWSHSPQTKGTGRFSASVNAATSTYTNNNFLGVNTNPANFRPDNATTKMSSNVSYSKTFPKAGLTLGVNFRHSQDLRTRRVEMPLPDLSLNLNNVYPFRKMAKGISSLENIAIRITTTGTNQITNSLGLQPKISSITGQEIVEKGRVVMVDSVADFKLKNFGTFFQNAKKGVRHTLPLGTSIKLLKFFTLSPNISFTETWYFDKYTYELDSTRTKAVVVDTVRGFNRINNFTFGMSLNTRIYGMAVFKRGKVKAIRHVLNPNISYSYQPDYTGNPEYFQKFYARTSTALPKNPEGQIALEPYLKSSDFRELVVSRHTGLVYGGSSPGRSSSLNFGLANSIEMKVKGEQDSVAKKISILNSLSINSGYNFYAWEYKLQPFSIGANTNVLDGKINLNFGGTIDPYTYRLDSIAEKTGLVYQTRIDRFVWRDRFSLGQLSNATITFSTNLNPKGNEKDQDTRSKIQNSNLPDAEKKMLMQTADTYVDFSIPWNLRVNYNFTYSRQGHLPSQIVQSVRFDGDISLSEKWKVQFNSGYDIDKKEFTQTSFNLTRDLHCWTMSLQWVPFGTFQSYSFYIAVKSSLLKDLKINRIRSFVDLGN